MQRERLFIVIRKHLPKIIRDSQHTCPKCQTEETDKQLQTAEGDAEMCNIKNNSNKKQADNLCFFWSAAGIG